ncbi:GGDEF domain-containing protein [Clostridium acetobutylicum]|uniref:GGDEF domain containing protein n=1 Tax=Clostridium acetobutylicum (strain ATCC 824 / DSM 792 / JCM 1419 / IAM 19013 / LMG 5710 / NBRC 13948 / NRRL B-527 / VKM B-1787 / 2291 / W) TaxID=272562 RepID=Q97FY7_CLOAB|nr:MULTISPECIES: diguanylate cyclase [Clostridium]AAK80536.1 GGDEF domain containing protein [Clostridium acetobutylicum ATCC 824]ADZ21635.1 GGDEF domain containing protein [Clostridium acetobutylicum EA 2018]AEI32450.1 GGDEF domain-containing protein [Clostridium acetobutylicum DSM 1731]AWV79046.1 diguanylate cyclase [Clostridium acetobutylicum]MBC2394993.1 diguanylate cyclase [Clostridium acetobutylicum]
MEKKREKSFLFKVFIIFMLSLISIAVCLWCVFFETKNHEENILKAYSYSQYDSTERLADKVYDSMENYISDEKMPIKKVEEKVIKNVLQKENNSKDKYVFFYNTKYVVFERNTESTAKYKNRSIDKVFELWEYNGGEDLSDAKSLMENGISGYSEVKKGIKNDKEIISWSFFKVGDEKYLVGMAASENYIRRETKLSQHEVITYVWSSMFTAVIIVISSLFVFCMFSDYKKIEKLENQLKKKNLQTEELVLEVNQCREIAEMAVTKDTITGVYNKEFLYRVIKGMKGGAFLPISVAAILLEGDFHKDEDREEFIISSAEVFKANCSDTDIISRTDDNEFVIVMTNTTEKDALKRLDKMRENVVKKYEGGKIRAELKVKLNEEESLLSILEASRMALEKGTGYGESKKEI